VPTKLVPPEPYEHDTFTLEGRELRIIEQGRTDCPDSTSLHVPSIGLIVAGDVVYNQCRMYVGDTTPESRKNWIAALDRLAALKPAIVVAGHKKPGAPDSPSTIQDTKRYLQDFDRLQKTATSDQELFDQMTELYPSLGSQSVVVDVRISAAITHINRLKQICIFSCAITPFFLLVLFEASARLSLGPLLDGKGYRKVVCRRAVGSYDLHYVRLRRGRGARAGACASAAPGDSRRDRRKKSHRRAAQHPGRIGGKGSASPPGQQNASHAQHAKQSGHRRYSRIPKEPKRGRSSGRNRHRETRTRARLKPQCGGTGRA
jgi:hypothetical protein